MSREVIIHGWGATPESEWFPSAKNELESLGHTVLVPPMPDPEFPRIKPWVDAIQAAVGETQKDDTFIGHSIGCQAIIRFLETQGDDSPIKRLILIAPWQYLTLEGSEEVVAPWQNTPIDFEKVRKVAGEVTAVFSDDDPWVPLQENSTFFEENLGARVIVKPGMGHFDLSELPFLPELVGDE